MNGILIPTNPRRRFLIAMALTGLAISTSTHAAPRGEILVVLSSEHAIDMQEGKQYKTGYFLNELTVPVKALMEAGYTITFANPKGSRPEMDTHSDKADFFNGNEAKYLEIRAFHDQLEGLKKPQKLANVVSAGLDSYQAVFFPGGHAPMQDLLADCAVSKVLHHFHKTGKPTALICHGPIALLAAMPNAANFVSAMRQGNPPKHPSEWIYTGYRMTIFSTAEEKTAEASQLGAKMLFYPEQGLDKAGGKVVVAPAWKSHVVRDRELITGQNPFSDDALVRELLRALADKHP